MHRNLWAAMGRVQVPQMIPSGEAEEPMTRATQVNASSASVTSCFFGCHVRALSIGVSVDGGGGDSDRPCKRIDVTSEKRWLKKAKLLKVVNWI